MRMLLSLGLWLSASSWTEAARGGSLGGGESLSRPRRLPEADGVRCGGGGERERERGGAEMCGAGTSQSRIGSYTILLSTEALPAGKNKSEKSSDEARRLAKLKPHLFLHYSSISVDPLSPQPAP